ncbi:hypothetical protein PR003_g20265 [Phytophthora rubi]|uniref:Uncharacterized protein n=1 Tax=Phytophthora rubi TaxID=129364 RepID=A0A6A3NAB2_9STRA|nr:hypothetical protein PR002_g12726 [Phytophthora rubi]KAE9040520.1 hypothetical protein PR001_g7027 [Phytophthora rubi]KAE9310444.1 hypothetical protein PR003_g20265 [Phytophthora rubi]
MNSCNLAFSLLFLEIHQGRDMWAAWNWGLCQSIVDINGTGRVWVSGFALSNKRGGDISAGRLAGGFRGPLFVFFRLHNSLTQTGKNGE